MKDRAGVWELNLIRSTAEQSIERGNSLDSQMVAAWLIKAMVDEIFEHRDNAPPRYQHDKCLTCHYLGQYGIYDLYFHADGTLSTYVSRWSDRSEDYKTAPALYKTFDPEFIELKARAMKKGLFPNYLK